MIPPKRFDIFPTDWWMLRRSTRCVQIFLLKYVVLQALRTSSGLNFLRFRLLMLSDDAMPLCQVAGVFTNLFGGVAGSKFGLQCTLITSMILQVSRMESCGKKKSLFAWESVSIDLTRIIQAESHIIFDFLRVV